MNERTPQLCRRFTLSELLVYILLVAVTLGVIRGLWLLEGLLPTGIEPVVGLSAWFLLGSMIGIPIAVLVAGRRYAVAGAFIGGALLLVLLFIAFAVIVHRTHRDHPTLNVCPWFGPPQSSPPSLPMLMLGVKVEAASSSGLVT
jgi:hypothetical protein